EEQTKQEKEEKEEEEEEEENNRYNFGQEKDKKKMQTMKDDDDDDDDDESEKDENYTQSARQHRDTQFKGAEYNIDNSDVPNEKAGVESNVSAVKQQNNDNDNDSDNGNDNDNDNDNDNENGNENKDEDEDEDVKEEKLLKQDAKQRKEDESDEEEEEDKEKEEEKAQNKQGWANAIKATDRGDGINWTDQMDKTEQPADLTEMLKVITNMQFTLTMFDVTPYFVPSFLFTLQTIKQQLHPYQTPSRTMESPKETKRSRDLSEKYPSWNINAKTRPSIVSNESDIDFGTTRKEITLEDDDDNDNDNDNNNDNDNDNDNDDDDDEEEEAEEDHSAGKNKEEEAEEEANGSDDNNNNNDEKEHEYEYEDENDDTENKNNRTKPRNTTNAYHTEMHVEPTKESWWKAIVVLLFTLLWLSIIVFLASKINQDFYNVYYPDPLKTLVRELDPLVFQFKDWVFNFAPSLSILLTDLTKNVLR
ncbi:hypothetical protein RFI_25578, partial [Reticulomyxa filosa]